MQDRVLLRLVEAVDLVDEEDRPQPVPPRRSRARASPPARRPRVRTQRSSSNSAPVRSATMRAIVVFPPGGPKRIIEGGRSCSIARRSAEPSPRTWLWPDEVVQGRRAHAHGERRALGEARRRLGEGSPTAEVCSGHGRGPRTTRSRSSRAARLRLRALPQHGGASRPAEGRERVGAPGRALFQVTHQSSELWLKLCWTDAREALA